MSSEEPRVEIEGSVEGSSGESAVNRIIEESAAKNVIEESAAKRQRIEAGNSDSTPKKTEICLQYAHKGVCSRGPACK